jgi:hypothetical protein
METPARAPATLPPVPRTEATTAHRGHQHDHAAGTPTGGPPPPDVQPSDQPGRDRGRTLAPGDRSPAPYPWDRDRDGWVDDPARFLEHADAMRAALAAAARAEVVDRQMVRAAGPIAPAAQSLTATSDGGAHAHAHAAVALANATAVASRASFPADRPMSRASARARPVPTVGAADPTGGAEVRRRYRPVVPVRAVASRYL